MWQPRKKQNFYYRSMRDRTTGKPKTIYVGSASSLAAQQAAQEDAQKKLQKCKEQEERRQREDIYTDMLSARKTVDLLTDGFRLANHYHFRKGEWHLS